MLRWTKSHADFTGYPMVDEYVKHYFDSCSVCASDVAVFFDGQEDTQMLSHIGLHGSFQTQSPEFVRLITIGDYLLYHTFILYTNENGVHIFSLKGTLDEASEQFLAEEVGTDD